MKMHTFYLIGFYCFLIITSFTFINLVLDFKTLRQTTIIIQLANIFFYSVLCYFFLGEYRKNKVYNDIPDNTNDVLEELKHKR